MFQRTLQSIIIKIHARMNVYHTHILPHTISILYSPLFTESSIKHYKWTEYILAPFLLLTLQLLFAKKNLIRSFGSCGYLFYSFTLQGIWSDFLVDILFQAYSKIQVTQILAKIKSSKVDWPIHRLKRNKNLQHCPRYLQISQKKFLCLNQQKN